LKLSELKKHQPEIGVNKTMSKLKIKYKYMIKNLLIIIAIIILSCFTALKTFKKSLKVGYIDNSRLMIGFTEAAKVEKELKAIDDEWRKTLKENE